MVKYSLNNVEDRLFKVEDYTYDMKDLKRTRTLESRMDFKYNLNRHNTGKSSDTRTMSNDRSNNVFERLAKKKSFLYYDEARAENIDGFMNNNMSNMRPDTASSVVRTNTNMSHNRDLNNSMIIQPTVKRPDSVRVKSHSQGNMYMGGSKEGSGSQAKDMNVAQQI